MHFHLAEMEIPGLLLVPRSFIVEFEITIEFFHPGTKPFVIKALFSPRSEAEDVRASFSPQQDLVIDSLAALVRVPADIMKFQPPHIGAQKARQVEGEVLKSEAPLRAESEILKIGDKRQTAGSFSPFINVLKDGRPIEAGIPEIGFPRYFRIFKKNLAGKPSLFKKSGLGEPIISKIGSFYELSFSKIGPPGKLSPVKISQFREFVFGKRNRARKIYLTKVIILPGQFGLQGLVKGIFILFGRQGMQDAQPVRVRLPRRDLANMPFP
ncbi:MAG: hypothetical protein WC443_04605 [Desulfobaccales bacterium]